MQPLHLALQVVDHELLPVEQRLAAVDVEAVLSGLRIVGHLGLGKREPRLVERILGLERLQFRIRAEFVGLAAALEFPLRGLLVDLRLLEGIALLQQLAFRVQPRAPPVDAQALQRRILLRQLRGQVRTVEGGEFLTTRHGVAGMHLERDRARHVGIQRRTDRRHHLTVRRHVAHEAAALHRRDGESLATHGRA